MFLRRISNRFTYASRLRCIVFSFFFSFFFFSSLTYFVDVSVEKLNHHHCQDKIRPAESFPARETSARQSYSSYFTHRDTFHHPDLWMVQLCHLLLLTSLANDISECDIVQRNY